MSAEEKIYKPEETRETVINPGDSSELPDVFFKVIVFIDNAYLIRLKNYLFKEKFKYNLKDFVLNIAKKNNFLVEKIFVYDAPPFQSEDFNEEEKKKKRNYDKYADFFKKQGIILREGRTQRLRAEDKFVYKQKGVDMLLGIDAISAKTEFPHITGIILLTGDSDFAPLVEKLRKLRISVFLWTYFDRIRKSPFSKSNHLIKTATKYTKITKEDFLAAEIRREHEKK